MFTLSSFLEITKVAPQNGATFLLAKNGLGYTQAIYSSACLATLSTSDKNA
jgi:hypothetical protein